MVLKWRYLLVGIIITLAATGGLDGCSSGEKQAPQQQAAEKPAPVTLKVVTSFALDAIEHDGFRIYVDSLKKKAADQVKIEIKGGPEAIPPNELAAAVSKGVVDMATLPESYYPHLVPEVRVIKLSPFTDEEERQNGIYELLNKIHQEKLNVYYLGRHIQGVPYHLFSNVKIEKASLQGITLRVSPTYVPLVKALGGQQVNIPGGEVYTAMERNVVKGFGWAGIGVVGSGWHEVTKYEIDPGFYTASTVTLVNLDKWNKLPDNVRKKMTEIKIETDKEVLAHYRDLYQKERAQRQAKGMQVIKLPDEEAKKFLQIAYDTAWQEVLETAPVYGPQLKKLMTK